MAEEAHEQRPLLPSDRAGVDAHPSVASTRVAAARRQVKRYLTSKTGHYSILLLVSLDISCIFADLLLAILTCEGRVARKNGNTAQSVLGDFSLVFSCLFMTELLASIWAFGWRQYFGSWFHWLDATVITAALVIDILLKGVDEEVGSLVVVLRLWRVFKIIEELSAGADEQMEPLRERCHDLERENNELKREVQELKKTQHSHTQ